MSGEMIERPEWLVGTPKEDWGTEDLGQYIVPPRIKVVQALSSEELTEPFDIGDCVIVPQKVKICAKNEKFHFTPIYFFPEWVVWNPLAMKGSLPAIRERSIDPASPIRRCATDPNLWTQKCPENQQEEIRFCEHLNFVLLIHDVPSLQNMPIVVSFARSEHKSGTNLSALIQMRRAPIYACRFQGEICHRKNNMGNWWGVEPGNPEDTPFVSEAEFTAYKELHQTYKEAHEKSQIQVDYGDDKEDPVKDTEF